MLLGNQTNGRFEGVVDSDRYPLRQTRWRNLYFNRNGRMTWERSAIRNGALRWVHGSRRQSYSYQAGKNYGGEFSTPNGPDELEFSKKIRRTTVIAGPMTARLRIASSAPDTELFVQLIDRGPNGEMLYLQRGMLRASHKRIMWGLSDKTEDGLIYRPWRPHTKLTPVTYMYVQKTPPGVNTLQIDRSRPSRLMLPLVPLDAVRWRSRPAKPCTYEEMRCVS